METTPYRVELHLHTCYSLLEGASHPWELASQAVELGYQALAITDHDGLYGAMEFAHACKLKDIQPITGVELTLRHGLHDAALRPVHLTLLAENARGYANLCRLITEAHAGDREPGARSQGVAQLPGLDPAFLEGHTEGLMVLSGCRQGELAQLIDLGRLEEALMGARRLANLFGPANTFVELQHNLVHGDTRRVARLAELAQALDLPIVATGNVHYHVRERHRLQDAMVAIGRRSTLEASHKLRRPNSEFFLKTPQLMVDVFARYPQAIANAAAIAERCTGFVLSKDGDLGYEFPDFQRAEDEHGQTADEVLARHCWARFEERYPSSGHPERSEGSSPVHETWARGPDSSFRLRRTAPQSDKGEGAAPQDDIGVGDESELLRQKAREQLKAELKLVAQHHMAGFFLIYRDLQGMATQVANEVRGQDPNRKRLPPGRGRGSSVSSIICYLIGLSHVDPVRNRLFFRRFLNEDLRTVPDIDLDFSREIREQLILRVYDHYHSDHAALVCSFATYHIRSAVRDIGKVLGLPEAAIDKLAKLSEGGGADTVAKELAQLPEFHGQAEGPLWQHLVELAAQIDDFPRHISQHVGGMIISSRPLIELVPVQPAAMEGRYICQWDKDSCDDARFIKIDFLALGMLSLIEECLEFISQNYGCQIDLAGLDYNDSAVYDAICKGDTVGTFQIESRAQIQMLPRTQPRTLDDLAVQVAIVRPGPIVANAVNPYVRRREELRRNPGKKFKAEHPAIQQVLEDTLGVILYQDQVLEVAIAMAGFTPGEADRFRRAMSRKRSHAEMESFRQRFIDGAKKKHGLSPQRSSAIFDKLAGFSDFGFPKSHAYAFAVLAYQSCWLRHYYPAEYNAALLNNQPMGFYEPNVIINDARRHGIQVLRPSINRSEVRSTAGGGEHEEILSPEESEHEETLSETRRPRRTHILLGLGVVRDMSDELAKAIVAERERSGPYVSLADLLRRTFPPRRVVEHLIAVGVLSEFGLSRRELLWQLGLLLPFDGSAPSVRYSRRKPQPALSLWSEADMVHLPDMDEWERMVADFGLLKLSPSYHPVALLRSELPPEVLSAAGVRKAGDGARVQTAGMVVCRQRPGTAKGIVFLLLEDETGLTNVVVRPDLYEVARSVVRTEAYVWIDGIVELRSDSLNVLALDIKPLAATLCPPRIVLRQKDPGGRPDPRETGHIEPQDLHVIIPDSHDFH